MNEQHTRAEIETALSAILADERFAGSPRMSAFLAYVVEQTLDGAAERIKAYTIGVDALGKPESFDPQGDPSVRVLANRLRASLDDYHRRCPDASPIVEIRRGGYRPLFLRASGTGRAEPVGARDGRTRDAPRPRPPVPVIRVGGTYGTGSLGAQLAAVAGSFLARHEGLRVLRRAYRDATLWPEDYELLFETIRLANGRRVEVQLVHAADETIVHGTTVHVAATGRTAETYGAVDGTADGAADGTGEVPPAVVGLIETFVATLAQPQGPLLRDYRARGDLAPYVVGWLARADAVPCAVRRDLRAVPRPLPVRLIG